MNGIAWWEIRTRRDTRRIRNERFMKNQGYHTLIDIQVYEVLEGKHVLIVTYLCKCPETCSVKISDKRSTFNWFPIEEVDAVNMPRGYVKSIRKATDLY